MTTTATDAGDRLLDRVRKLLAKAEDPGVTEPEREALVGKATELMAKYGIDRALLDAARADTGKPIDRIFTVENPWPRVKVNLLAGLTNVMRCKAILLTGRDDEARVHVFGYQSDVERAEVLYTSLLLQMAHGLARQHVPPAYRGRRAMAWRRSWMLGFITTVVQRVQDAEVRAAAQAEARAPWYGVNGQTSTALVLADRASQSEAALRAEYPMTRTARVTYTGRGYGDGQAAGRSANLGGTGVGRRTAGALR